MSAKEYTAKSVEEALENPIFVTIEKLQESEVGVSEEGKEAEKQETLNILV